MNGKSVKHVNNTRLSRGGYDADIVVLSSGSDSEYDETIRKCLRQPRRRRVQEPSDDEWERFPSADEAEDDVMPALDRLNGNHNDNAQENAHQAKHSVPDVLRSSPARNGTSVGGVSGAVATRHYDESKVERNIHDEIEHKMDETQESGEAQHDEEKEKEEEEAEEDQEEADMDALTITPREVVWYVSEILQRQRVNGEWYFKLSWVGWNEWPGFTWEKERRVPKGPLRIAFEREEVDRAEAAAAYRRAVQADPSSVGLDRPITEHSLLCEHLKYLKSKAKNRRRAWPSRYDYSTYEDDTRRYNDWINSTIKKKPATKSAQPAQDKKALKRKSRSGRPRKPRSLKREVLDQSQYINSTLPQPSPQAYVDTIPPPTKPAKPELTAEEKAARIAEKILQRREKKEALIAEKKRMMEEEATRAAETLRRRLEQRRAEEDRKQRLREARITAMPVITMHPSVMMKELDNDEGWYLAELEKCQSYGHDVTVQIEEIKQHTQMRRNRRAPRTSPPSSQSLFVPVRRSPRNEQIVIKPIKQEPMDDEQHNHDSDDLDDTNNDDDSNISEDVDDIAADNEHINDDTDTNHIGPMDDVADDLIVDYDNGINVVLDDDDRHHNNQPDLIDFSFPDDNTHHMEV